MDETIARVLGHINSRSGIPLDKLKILEKDIDPETLSDILQAFVKEGEIQEIPASELYPLPRYYPKWTQLPRELPDDDEPEELKAASAKNTMPQIYLGKTGDTDIIEARILQRLEQFVERGERFTLRQVLDAAGYATTALKRRPHLREKISIESTKIIQKKAKEKAATRSPAAPLVTKQQAIVAVTRDFSRHVEVLQVRGLRDNFGLIRQEIQAGRKTVLVHRGGNLIAGIVSLRMFEVMDVKEEPLTLPIGDIASLFRLIWEALEIRQAVVISRYNQPTIVFISPKLLERLP